MNVDEILEQINNARWEFEEADREVTKAHIRKDRKIKQLSIKLNEAARIIQEIYKKSAERDKKVKICKKNNGK